MNAVTFAPVASALDSMLKPGSFLPQQTNLNAQQQQANLTLSEGTIPPELMNRIYDSLERSTPLTRMFFDPRNVEFLRSSIAETLSLLMNRPVQVQVTEDFMNAMLELARTNVGLAYTGTTGLQTMNQAFVESEARLQLASLRHDQLFNQYFIDQDRLWEMPRAQGDRRMKGETQINTSGYMLSHPNAHSYDQFLSEVLGIQR